MTVHGAGVVLAASWTHNFSSWQNFVNWLNNSNFAGLILGIVVPGIFTYGFVYYQHHKTRAHITAHHENMHARLDHLEHRLFDEQEPPAASN